MADVALIAGTSITTVSHYLNQTRPVHPRTATAIELAVRRTGYVRNDVARSLATSVTKTVGLAISAVSNPYLGEIVRAVEDRLLNLGYTTLVVNTHDVPDRELRAVRAIHRRRVDGLLLVTALDPERLAGMLPTLGDLPVVLLDQIHEGIHGVDQVGLDNVRATSMLVEHLLMVHGYERLAYVGGRQNLATSTERLRGFTEKHNEFGLRCDPRLVIVDRPSDEDAEKAVAGLLDLPDPPRAIVAGTGYIAIGALRAIRARGLSIPEDVALVNVDRIDWDDLLDTSLTCIVQPYNKIADEAASRLLESMNDANSQRPRDVFRVTGQLRLGGSCGCEGE